MLAAKKTDKIESIEIKNEKEDAEISSNQCELLDEEIEYKRILRKIDYRILIVYSISYIFTQIDKGNISNVAILNLESGHNIKKELGNLSSQQWAWCLSVFYYPYLFFEPPFTMLAKKFTPRIWQSRIMISWGIVSMLQAATFNYSGMIACRFFLGFFEASWYTTVLYHMSFFYKPRELPKRIAIFYSFGMLSGAFSGLLAYGISFLDQVRGLSGWQWVFILEGIPTIIIGIYTSLRLPNFVENSKFLDTNEKRIVLSQLPSSSPKKEEKAFNMDQIKELLKDPTFYTYSGIWIFQGIGGWGISFVLPTIVYELGFTDSGQTQLMQLPPSIAGFILLNLLGHLIHKRKIKSFPTALVLSFVQIICYIVLLTIKSSAGKYAMLIIATLISNSLYPIMWPDRIRVVRGASSAGLAIGFTNASTQLMGIIGPLIYQSQFGPSYHISYACSIALCTISLIFIGATWYFVSKSGIIDTEGATVSDDEET